MGLLRSEVQRNVYASQIENVLPQILALGDGDALSPTQGVMDRQYWAWKLIDFPNATFQGAVNGLSGLLTEGAFENSISSHKILSRIEDICLAAGSITRPDGSMEEAFPFEKSYCVTALVAFDTQKALDGDVVRKYVERKVDCDALIGPWINFLKREDETHGFISNHLATAAAALLKWHERCGDLKALAKADALISRILEAQSEEGWFREYDGADPGYETLCLSYLAECAPIKKSERLWDSLGKSVKFLTHFAHPDGSFGGHYGSRSTRLYYPAGVEALSERFPVARSLALHMRKSIEHCMTVPLTAIDAPNLMPLFNNYCAAFKSSSATTFEEGSIATEILPAYKHGKRRLVFEDAGLIVDGGERHYTIISTRKGGVVYHWRNGVLNLLDCGMVLEDRKRKLFTSQASTTANEVFLEKGQVRVQGRLRPYVHPLPNAFNFLILRIMSLTVLRFSPLNTWIKKALAWFLMGTRARSGGAYFRTITFGEELKILDGWDNRKLRRIRVDKPFNVIHMASQGYWQRQDDLRSDIGSYNE